MEKEILEVGEGAKVPGMQAIATIIYRAYFLADHHQFDSSEGKPIKIDMASGQWPDGLSRAVE